MQRDRSFEWLFTRPIAHRGFHDIARGIYENSLAAFREATEKQYPAELDVRLLSDGEVCVYHDDNTLRLTGIDRPVADLCASDLASFRLGETDQTIPLLREVLAAVDGKVPLLVELKNEGPAGDLERAVSALLLSYKGKAAVQSFNPHTVRWFSLHAPSVPRGQLGGRMRDTDLSILDRFLLRTLLCTVYSRPGFIGFETWALPCLPCSVHRRLGVPVLAWTVRSREEALRVRMHCDNIIFEGFDPVS